MIFSCFFFHPFLKIHDKTSVKRFQSKAFVVSLGLYNIYTTVFFYAQSLTKKLKECVKLNKGATVILHPVSNPSSYGVASINKKNKITKIIEKPKKFFSNLAITGLYFFDNNVVNYSKNLKPSKRKEIEMKNSKILILESLYPLPPTTQTDIRNRSHARNQAR